MSCVHYIPDFKGFTLSGHKTFSSCHSTEVVKQTMSAWAMNRNKFFMRNSQCTLPHQDGLNCRLTYRTFFIIEQEKKNKNNLHLLTWWTSVWGTFHQKDGNPVSGAVLTVWHIYCCSTSCTFFAQSTSRHVGAGKPRHVEQSNWLTDGAGLPMSDAVSCLGNLGWLLNSGQFSTIGPSGVISTMWYQI